MSTQSRHSSRKIFFLEFKKVWLIGFMLAVSLKSAEIVFSKKIPYEKVIISEIKLLLCYHHTSWLGENVQIQGFVSWGEGFP